MSQDTDYRPEDKREGYLPLRHDHMCFDKGHSMYPVYVLHNHQSSYGRNKCSRCGWEEDWQYDYEGSNPMYYKQ